MFYTSAIVWGNNILERGVDNHGQSFKSKKQFSPTMFVASKTKSSEYKLLDGKSVEPITPGTIKDTKEFIEKYSDVGSFNIYGQTNFQYQFLAEEYPGTVNYDSSKIRIHYIDLESESEFGFPELVGVKEKINAITVYDSIVGNPISFCWNDFEAAKVESEVVKCASEADMFRRYIQWHSSKYPDVLTGWYSNGFDIPYMCRRIEKVLGEEELKKMSPWGTVNNTSRKFKGSLKYETTIIGIACIDYLDLYKKFILSPRENYKLDTIAEIELGRKKLDYSEFKTFKDFYTGNFTKFLNYNIVDTVLVYELEQKLKIMEVLFTVAYMAKVNFEDVFSPIRTWENIIYNYLRDKNIVIPESSIRPRADFEGGFVKEITAGLYHWIASFDLQSSYPHQIMQYSISPENLIDERMDVSLMDLVDKKVDLSALKERNITMTANGQMFKRGGGLFPELIQSMYNQRSDAKKEMKKYKAMLEEDKDNEEYKNKISSFNNLQHALKILMNSLYGAWASVYFRYYDSRIAEGITLSSQLAIHWMNRKFNEFFNKKLGTQNIDYVKYNDTDSIYLTLEAVVEKIAPNKSTVGKINAMDKFCQEILSPYIEKCFVEMAEYMNATEQKMAMGRDTLTEKAIFCSKKKYILLEHDSEGVRYSEPKKKVVGLQMIQSSTPKVMKEKLVKALDIIIDGDEVALQKYVLEVEREFRQYSIEEVSSPSGIDGMIKYADDKKIYQSGVPFHVRGALMHNHLVKQFDLDKHVAMLRDGDKIRYTYLLLPNPSHENVISFTDSLPEEFGLHRYIDWETQFSKVFLGPLKTILNAIKWTPYMENDLGDLFG